VFDQPLVALPAFIAAGLVILFAGVRIAHLADVLADRTGLGEALVGAVLLGIGTSLSGVVTTITAAAGGHPDLALSNALGGIAAQTFFLALADLIYRKSNLEHAAADATNLLQATLLILLLGLPAIAMVSPEVTIFWIHPVTPLIVGVYLYGLRLTGTARAEPMWMPKRTRETRLDEPEDEGAEAPSTGFLALQFAGLLCLVGSAGWVIAETAVVIAAWAALSESLVGALFTAVVTSLPELVTTLAAVRRGALQLAVGGIIGGNTFDVLFLVGADLAYLPGSILHAVGQSVLFLMLWGSLMTAILLLGLILRQREGPWGIGVESMALILVFALGVAVQAVGG